MKLGIRNKKMKKSLIRPNQKYQKKEFKLNQVMRIWKKGNHLIKAKKKLIIRLLSYLSPERCAIRRLVIHCYYFTLYTIYLRKK